jgi:predicted acyl esterase
MTSAGGAAHRGSGICLIVALLFVLLAVPADAERKPALKARGSVNQVYVTNAKPRERVVLKRDGRTVDTGKAGKLGGALFREVVEGGGYRVRSDGRRASDRLRVMSGEADPPSTDMYEQELPDTGYGYLRTRDGTKLAVSVRKPAGPGPHPTLVEYSGYGYANPAGAEAGISPIANLLGFAVVDVNMRGTGCSGGAFDYFERLQSLDGYDVIETVARQPWVAPDTVGMAGVSYGGISQLFVGATNPPHLAAITPLSVIDDTAATLYPGGILNTGFALPWAEDRVDDAKPATATTGQGWAYERIQDGDRVCKRNQVLHTEAPDLIQKVRDNQDYVPEVADPLSPNKFVDEITVPVFMACQWNVEQTGAHCPRLARNITGTDKKWFTFTNGLHIDALDPETFNRWYDFLKLYVAQEKPNLEPVAGLAPSIFQQAMGIPGVELPSDPIQDEPTYEAALAAFEDLPPVRILFDSGAGETGAAGTPYPGFEESYESFPIPDCSPSPTPPCTEARSWYLGDGEALTDAAPDTEGTDSFTWDVGARPPTNFTGNTGAGGLWGALPGYNWEQVDDTNAASYLTDPLPADVGIVGAGALEAWVRSPVPDVDLQVTISEVRPDGKETYVQSGWLRASRRKLDLEQSTTLEPVPTFSAADREDMPEGEFAQLTVPLYYQGHVYRAGSRLRVTITAPSGDQPVWSFAETVPETGTPTIEIAHSPEMPSRLVLPLIQGLSAPTDLPPCPSLRAQPCRDFATP